MEFGISGSEGSGAQQCAPLTRPLSPLLCNAYLHRLDRAWQAGEHGVLVRYVDDAVVMCDTREQAEAALARLTVLLAGLGLEPKAAKTRIVQLAEGTPGLTSSGFITGWYAGGPRNRRTRPSSPAGPHARLPSMPATGSGSSPAGDGCWCSRVIVTELNRFLRGWAGHFRYGNSARVLGQVGNYASGGSGCGCPKEATAATAGGGA